MAESLDAYAIQGLVSRAFAPWIATSVYRSPRSADYLKELLGLPDSIRPALHVVALDGDSLVGYAELAQTATAHVLTYICVENSSRSRGVGRRLLAEALRRAEAKSQLRTVELDVYWDNPRARDWYRELGFVATGSTRWYELQSEHASPFDCRVEGWPQARVTERQFGFGHCRVDTATGPVRALLIDDTSIRLVGTTDSVRDGHALFQRLAPARTVIAGVPLRGRGTEIPGVPLWSADRMVAELHDVMAGLRQ